MTPHPADEELIVHLYGAGSDDRHIASCAECQARLSQMRVHRQVVERESVSNEISLDFLAAQRRRIYQRISEPVRWWSHLHVRHWVSAAAGLAVMTGGL